MKCMNVALSAAAAGLLFLCGCDDTPRGWFKTEGGYINLSQVCCIETHGVIKINDAEIFNAPLDENKLLQARAAVSNAAADSHITLNAVIRFDKNNFVELSSGKGVSVSEALMIIDSWSVACEHLINQLPEMQ